MAVEDAVVGRVGALEVCGRVGPLGVGRGVGSCGEGVGRGGERGGGHGCCCGAREEVEGDFVGGAGGVCASFIGKERVEGAPAFWEGH